MMFAVVKTGGKQYRVAPGDVVLVERLAGEEGQPISLTDVLMVYEGGNITIGSPLVSGVSIEATIKAQTRGDKIIVFKKKRRQGYRRKKGHRQDLTLLTINSIQASKDSGKPKVSSEDTVKASPSPSDDAEVTPQPKVTRAKKTPKAKEE